MATTINAVPGKQKFQRTARRPQAPAPHNPFYAIRPVETAMSAEEMYDRFRLEKPIQSLRGFPQMELCRDCAQGYSSDYLVSEDCLDAYEVREAYLTGWPCTECDGWAVAPQGCVYSEGEADCTMGAIEDEGCINQEHQAKRLVAEENYPADAAKTLIGLTWMAYREARRG